MPSENFLFAKEPMLTPTAMFGRTSFRSPGVPLDWRVALGHSARYALYQVLVNLPLEESHEILMPAYSCISLVEAARCAGLRVRFYDTPSLVETNLKLVADRICPRTKLVLVIHYFGFEQSTQALSALCKQHGVLLVEDFAHSLPPIDLSNEEVRLRHCDIALFSLKKHLPVPDGGFAVYRKALPISLSLQKPPQGSAIFREVYRGLEKALRDRLGKLGRALRLDSSPTRRRFPIHSSPEDLDRPPSIEALPPQHTLSLAKADWSTSATALKVWARASLGQIAKTRLQNERFVRSSLARFPQLAFPIPPGKERDCLWALPFLATSVQDVDLELRRRGIPVFTFARPLHPFASAGDFQAAKFWSRNLKLLPIHQGLAAFDLAKVTAAFESILLAS